MPAHHQIWTLKFSWIAWNEHTSKLAKFEIPPTISGARMVFMGDAF
jgi:hypothetical protein